MSHNIAIARGDGIGPEIMDAVLRILQSAKVDMTLHEVLVGEQAYLAGHSGGIHPDAWDVIRKCKVLLKAPLTTPQGGGFKSANVTIRKTLGLYANVRPSVSYAPVLQGPSALNIVIIRENEEDLYAGIEHRQTEDVYQCLKLITRPGCERISHFAFEYARQNGRKRITCLSKDNIMKMTDGLFHKVFMETAERYPEITADHLIVDIGTARLASRPGQFDVVLAPNLYGDIISDVVAEVAGSIGLAPSANIGSDCAMFEAVHGSAPDIAGRGIANPSALLLSAIMMLVHIGEGEKAALIHNALLATLESGVHTGDLRMASGYDHRPACNTAEFADAVISHLGSKPHVLPIQCYAAAKPITTYVAPERPKAERRLMGVDVFVCADVKPDQLAERMRGAESKRHNLKLQVITNRGVKVWPNGLPETYCTDHWRCRFMAEDTVGYDQVLDLLQRVTANDEVIKTENLYEFDHAPGYSAAQGL